MNTLLICLSVGQLACVFALAWMNYQAVQDREKAEVAIICLEKYMEGHGLPVPTEEELADYINDRAMEDNA